MTLSALSVEAYARKLASADPTPGGGSASALVGALGASLTSMVAQLTAGSPKFAALAPRMQIIAQEARGLCAKLLAAIDEDVIAFDRVSAAYKLPKTDDAAKRARSAAIQAALAGACEPPLHVVELAARCAQLAVELVDAGNPNAISDAGCAMLFAQAAARGAALNVRINLKALRDATLASSYEQRLDDMLAQIGLLAEVALVKVERAVTRESGDSV